MGVSWLILILFYLEDQLLSSSLLNLWLLGSRILELRIMLLGLEQELL